MTQQRNLLTTGLGITLRNWPTFVWTSVFNLITALMFTLPLRTQIGAVTAHSLASQPLTNGFDLGVMAGMIMKLTKGPGPAAASSNFTAPVYVLIYFLIVPGALFCYQSGVRAKLATMLHTGLIYFWRFVRIVLVNLVISGIIIGGLMALQKLWSAHVDETIVGRKGFLLELVGLVIIALVASALRLYFDLVEVYTVQLGSQLWPEGAEIKPKRQRQILRTLGPAWRTLRGNFFRAYITFLFIGAIGVGAVLLAARFELHSLAQPHVFPLVLVAQVGLFVMLLTRFWQRGAETVLALENPLAVPVVVVVEAVVPVAIAEEPADEEGYDPEVLEAPPTEAHHTVEPPAAQSPAVQDKTDFEI